MFWFDLFVVCKFFDEIGSVKSELDAVTVEIKVLNSFTYCISQHLEKKQIEEAKGHAEEANELKLKEQVSDRYLLLNSNWV